MTTANLEAKTEIEVKFPSIMKLELGEVVTWQHGTQMIYLGTTLKENSFAHSEFIGYSVNFPGSARILRVGQNTLSFNEEGRLKSNCAWSEEIIPLINTDARYAAKIKLLNDSELKH